MPNSYSTLANVKALMADISWSTKYDTVLTNLLARSSRLIDGYYPERELGSFSVASTSARYFDGSGTPRLLIDELAAAPSIVAVAETGVVDTDGGSGGTYTTWAVTDYRCWPYNAIAKSEPVLALEIDILNGSKAVWYAFPKSVKITGYWGYAASGHTPEIIKHACEAQTLRMWGEAQQKYADVSAIAELGQMKYAQSLHPEVKMILDASRFAQLGGLF